MAVSVDFFFLLLLFLLPRSMHDHSDDSVIVFLGRHYCCNQWFLFWSLSFKKDSDKLYILEKQRPSGRSYLIVTFGSFEGLWSEADLSVRPSRELFCGSSWTWRLGFKSCFWHWGMISVESLTFLEPQFPKPHKTEGKSTIRRLWGINKLSVKE